MAITKELKTAIPTTDATTGFVVQWIIGIFMSDNEDPPFEKYFEFPTMVAYPTKKPEDYTAEELINMFPMNIDHVFDHHKHVKSAEYKKPHEENHIFKVEHLNSGKPKKGK